MALLSKRKFDQMYGYGEYSTEESREEAYKEYLKTGRLPTFSHSSNRGIMTFEEFKDARSSEYTTEALLKEAYEYYVSSHNKKEPQ